MIVPEPTTTEQLNAIDARHVHPILRAMLDNREAWYELPLGAVVSHNISYSSTDTHQLYFDVRAIKIGIYTLPMESRTTGDGRKWHRVAYPMEWDRLGAFIDSHRDTPEAHA